MTSEQISLLHRFNRLWNKLLLTGPRQTFRSLKSAFRPKTRISFPLANADPDLILASSVSAIRDFARRKQGEPAKLEIIKDAARDGIRFFPNEFVDSKGASIRYAFFPALKRSKGLVVIFHGYLGFKIDVLFSWNDFDLLLPLDNFGWKNLGSLFWGEAGVNFVESAVQELIQSKLPRHEELRWYCVGASMGGSAALYHGIKYKADGIYVMAPIINLKSKINNYRSLNVKTSYTSLANEADNNLSHVPDIYEEAQDAETLPPLFLIQNQFDRSNPFGDDTLPLLNIYNEKKAWMGLRVQPAIGHLGHDGSYVEAQYFFNLLSDKRPPRRVDFYDKDESSL